MDDPFEHFIFLRVLKNCKLCELQMVQHFNNLFEKELLLYFNTYVMSETLTCKEIEEIMFHHFVSHDIQYRVNDEIQSLSFNYFV